MTLRYEKMKSKHRFSIICPYSSFKKFNILIDKYLSRFNYIYGAAGHPDCVFKIIYNNNKINNEPADITSRETKTLLIDRFVEYILITIILLLLN